MSSAITTAKRPHGKYYPGGAESLPENNPDLVGDCAEAEAPDSSKFRKISASVPASDDADLPPPQSQRLPPVPEGRRGKEEAARRVWRKATAVCFDVDSTVCMDEAIDELADFCGVGEEVAAWTIKAMNGNFSFREALSARLDLIKPSRLQLEEYVQRNPPKLTLGIKELVGELRRRGAVVYLVSGGFTRIILPVAAELQIPEENVFANVLHFDENGKYRGFDESQPTSDSGGKTEVCRMLKQKFHHATLVMVGDGATDMEAAPPADTFVGFGGNQIREKVKSGAPWFVTSFQELLDELRKSEE